MARCGMFNLTVAPPSADRADGGRRAGMVVANFGRDFHFLRRCLERNPIAAFDLEFIAVQRGVVADDDAVLRRIQFDHVERLGRGNPKALALADGEKLDAVVVAEQRRRAY